ncbi:ACP S-malonyltransferase [Bacillus songklensis]|uniref:Malonyl CoA-acyl carrier protein transacylase n=1 Tax=Bacillus songklensis TaxID=1069116 RepID=A0ABV8AZ86_9BACI
MGKLAFVFPGQGSQTVGMGKDFADQYEVAGSMYNQVDDVLGFKLTDIIFNGSQEKLTLTYHAQPALLATSMVMLEQFKTSGIAPDYTAGHSLGEYSALVAAGALSFPDAVKAVYLRGKFMDEAVPAGEGTMAAILGMEAQALKEVTDEITNQGDVVQLANINCPGQIVISGTTAGVEKASALAKERGAKRAISLVVSGPFHSSLMKPAAQKLEQVLNEVTVTDAEVPVISNVTAEPMTTKGEIKQRLVEQLYSPVRWEESIQTLLDNGVDTFIEIGPGKVLAGLIKKINRRANVFSVYDLQSMNQTIEAIKEEKSC